MKVGEKLGKDCYQIGHLTLGSRVALAPMSGISDVAMRRLALRFGAGVVVTEMVASDAFLRGGAEATLRAEGAGVWPHVVQLVGRDPRSLSEAARVAEVGGADIIDINMGCPAKRVTGGLSGSALMREPDLACRIIAAVVGATRLPVTVKMRLGWDDFSRNAAALCRAARDLGAVGFVVHGRTRQQFYAGRADWCAIRDAVEAVDVPVMANGDVVSPQSALACLEASGAAGVMIGRAAIGQPWLIGAVATALDGVERHVPGYAERADAAVEHYEALLGLYGRALGARHARKHIAAYADRAADAGFGLGPHERQVLVTSEEPAEVVGLLSRIYAERLRSAA